MTLPFVTLALLMLTAAALVIVLPLWRVAGRGGIGASPLPWRWHALWLVTGLVMAAAGTYGVVGEPAALLLDQAKVGALPVQEVRAPQEAPITEGKVDQARIEAMVQGLAERLKTRSQDPAGWRMLARSYETLGRFGDAVGAYRQLFSLQAPDADQLLDFAVTLGMNQGQSLAGEPEAAINQALALDPRHIQALALSGSAAFEQRDYPRAVGQWQKLLALIPQDAPMRESIARNIDKARNLASERR